MFKEKLDTLSSFCQDIWQSTDAAYFITKHNTTWLKIFKRIKLLVHINQKGKLKLKSSSCSNG